MPYIISTSVPSNVYGASGLVRANVPHETSRTAVATLDEARGHAYVSIHAAYSAAHPHGEHSDAQRAHRWRILDAEKLPESGGTIGPLPDGTIIEVRPATPAELWADAGESGFPLSHQSAIAAFNAA